MLIPKPCMGFSATSFPSVYSQPPKFTGVSFLERPQIVKNRELRFAYKCLYRTCLGLLPYLGLALGGDDRRMLLLVGHPKLRGEAFLDRETRREHLASTPAGMPDQLVEDLPAITGRHTFVQHPRLAHEGQRVPQCLP